MNLANRIIKKKRLQVLGHASVVIIPKKWLDELGWTRQTNLKVIYHPETKSMSITENEEISSAEPEPSPIC
jgi:hypothetical protein